MILRAYQPSDRDAVIALFRAFMQELTPPGRRQQFEAYVARAIRMLLAMAEVFCRECGYRRVVLNTTELQSAARSLYESSGYRLAREERDMQASHKSVGAGFVRYYYEKMLA